MAKNINKLITYLHLIQETFKLKEQEVKTQYVDVDIELPDDLVIHERWYGSTDRFHTVEFPLKDIEGRIKTARDHLRYLKRRKNGQKYGE